MQTPIPRAWELSSLEDETFIFVKLIPSVFNNDEVEYIKNIALNYPAEAAKVSNNAYKHIRQNTIRWISPDDKSEYIYRKMVDCVLFANDHFKVDISFLENFQYAEYYSDTNDHFDAHLDIGKLRDGYGISRKLTAITMLSDSNEYTGGDLQTLLYDDFINVPLNKGDVVIMPSFILHRVTPVLSGVRKTLVSWACGNGWR